MHMVSGKSRLEREAAIHERYSRLKEMATQDVAGLSEGKKHLMSHLLGQAQMEATRIANSAELTAEQKVLRGQSSRLS